MPQSIDSGGNRVMMGSSLGNVVLRLLICYSYESFSKHVERKVETHKLNQYEMK